MLFRSPLRSGALFPGTTLTLPVGRVRSVALLDTLSLGSFLGVAVQRDAAVSDPGEGDLHDVGTFARVARVERTRDRGYRVTLEGLARFELARVVGTEPFWLAEGRAVEETHADTAESRLLAQSLREHVKAIAGASGGALAAIADDADPGAVADQIAGSLGLSVEKELAVLRERDVTARLRLVSDLVAEARELAGLKAKIESDVRREFGKNQRDALLREQIRALRNRLLAMNPDGEPKTLVVTSAVRGEGKSLTALNLAMAFAELDRHEVCVVDADLRGPSCERYLNLNAQPGLTDVLSGTIALDKALRDVGHRKLKLLSAGTPVANPAEVLGVSRLDELFARLKERFQYVVIDTPPVLSCTDAGVISARADGTMMVLRLEHSLKGQTKEAVRNLQDLGANVLGSFVCELRGVDPTTNPRLSYGSPEA